MATSKRTRIVDEFVPMRPVAHEFGRTSRTIYSLVQAGMFPPPDVKGSRGRSNLWLRSRLDEHKRRLLAGETPIYSRPSHPSSSPTAPAGGVRCGRSTTTN